jgi:hypothetical protein
VRRRHAAPESPGITLSDVWSFYDRYNQAVTDLCRQIAYAGIAVIWVFRVSAGGLNKLPRNLFIAGFLLVLCLFLDFCQNVAGSLLYDAYGRRKEKEIGNNEERFLQPNWLLWPMDLFFFAKVGALVVGYVLILWYLIANIVSAA